MSGYESLWGSEVLSDVDVVLSEDAEEPGTKRKQNVTISSHKVVLACNSEYFRAQLVDWSPNVPDTSSSNASSNKLQISLSVPVGQLELGQLLLKHMYQDKVNLTDLQQASWLSLLLLADKYAVPKVLTALCDKLASIDMPWEIVTEFYTLPDSVIDNQRYKAIKSAVRDKVQKELGDLEVVWSSKEKQQMLLQLPHRAVKSLLVNNNTKVASENTVAHTVLCWISAQPQSPGKTRQLQRLLKFVRMAQCTRLYVATVLSNNADIRSCLSPYELQVMGLCQERAYQQFPSAAMRDVWERYPAWCSSTMRPSSAVQALDLSWSVQTQVIKQLFEQCTSTQQETAILQGPSATWQGRTVGFGLQLSPANDDFVRQADGQFVKVAGCSTKAHVMLCGSEMEMAKFSYHLSVNKRDPPLSAARGMRLVVMGAPPPKQGSLTSHQDGTMVTRIMYMRGSTWAEAEAYVHKIPGVPYLNSKDSLLHLEVRICAID